MFKAPTKIIRAPNHPKTIRQTDDLPGSAELKNACRVALDDAIIYEIVITNANRSIKIRGETTGPVSPSKFGAKFFKSEILGRYAWSWERQTNRKPENASTEKFSLTGEFRGD
ncbi:MAG: hypothetical protein ACI8XO_002744 [Verrucomicrobiales bacterium]|jgi:hypothetical protein